MVALTWRTPARISVSGPDGWFPVERIGVQHAERDAHVSVESWPGEGDRDEFAARYVATRLAPLGWRQDGAQTVTTLGCPDSQRLRGTLETGSGPTVSLTIDFCPEPGRTTVITSVLTAPDDDLAAEAEAIIASIRMGSYFDATTDAVLTASPGEWTSDTEGVDLRLTFEEALAVAEHYDVSTLPGVDPRYLSALEPPARELVRRVAERSVTARDGFAAGPVAAALAVAARHDALLTVERPGAEPQWLALAGGVLVEVERDGAAAMVELRLRPLTALAERLIPTSATPGEPGESIECASSQLAAVLAGAPALPALAGLRGASAASVRGVRREAGTIVGGEVEWVTTEAAMWSVERPDAATVRLVPAGRAELLARVGGLLPMHLRERAGLDGPVRS